MKRIYFILSITMMIAVVFQSCKKDEQSSPATIDLTKSATIKGMVKANLDLFNDTSGTKYENAPQGTKLIFQVSASDFPLDPSGNYDDILYTTTVDASGKYSITVPANNKGVNYTITAVDFEYDQGQVKWAGSYFVTDGVKRKIFSFGTSSVNNIVTGDTRVEDIIYSNN